MPQREVDTIAVDLLASSASSLFFSLSSNLRAQSLYLSRQKDQYGHRVCWMLLRRKNETTVQREDNTIRRQSTKEEHAEVVS